MKRSFKTLLFLCAFFALASFMLAGCGNRGNGGFTSDGKYLISIWGGDEYTGETKAKLESFLTQFNESTVAEELNVELTFKAQTNLPGTMTGALMTANGPDLVIWDRYMTPAGTDILAPLNDLIENETSSTFDLSKLNQPALAELVYGGSTYGLPLDLDPWGIYVNLDVVDAYNAGVTGTDKVNVSDITTWSTLKAAAQKLTVRNGNTVTRAGLNVTSMDGQFVSYLSGANADLIDLDPSSPTFGDTTMQTGASRSEQAKRVNELFYFIKDLYDSNICSNSLGGTDAFVAGQCAMTYGSMFFPQTIKNQIGSSNKTVRYKYIPFPRRDLAYSGVGNATVVDPEAVAGGLKNGTYGGMMGGYGLSIAWPAYPHLRTAKWEARRDKSWEVIKAVLFNDEINRMFFTTTEQITTRNDLVSDAYYNTDSVMKDAIPYLECFRIRPNVAGYETFESNVLRAQLQSMYEGTQTVNTTYQNVMNLGNAELRRAQNRA